MPLARQLMGRPEMQFLVTLELEGADAALDLLQSLATGPRWAEVYPPVFPALIGPDALRTDWAQEVLCLVAERR